MKEKIILLSDLGFFLTIIIFCLICYMIGNHYEKKSEERQAIRIAAQEAYKKTPAGLDEEAKYKSSVTSSIVISQTGAKFFNGKRCIDCKGYMEGYYFAYEYGIAKDDICYEKFEGEKLKGCKEASSSIRYDIQKEYHEELQPITDFE